MVGAGSWWPAALLAALLALGPAQPVPQAPPPAAGPPAANGSLFGGGRPVSAADRLDRLERRLGTLEESVVKLANRMRVVTGNLQNILQMVAPMLSPVVNAPVRPTVPAAAVSTATPPATSACPSGYSRVGAARPGRRLCLSGLSAQPLTQPAAAQRCRATGGRLLQLETNVKFHLVKGLLADDRPLWVGAGYRKTANDFYWSSGGQRVQVKVQGSAARGATCVVLIMFRTAGHLAAQNCRLPRYFVCEKLLT
ncbi:uncharacterized protein LOC122377469 [Amphibalanus amphitrite]|uniref:uncharacterized protein LOC122377469 n=1 Tax=Amphibalanus amphitrite TaxID=1232801 RepID=UPI001C92A0C8|nr:uncharacterized protein LOC122377469 [Amphibalanus amphitrite]